MAWNSDRNYTADTTAFLFILCSANGVLAPEKLPVIADNAEEAVSTHEVEAGVNFIALFDESFRFMVVDMLFV